MAGLTFQFTNPVASRAYHRDLNVKGGWNDCNLRITSMIESGDIANKLPNSVKDAISPVLKQYASQGQVKTTADSLFITSLKEILGSKYDENNNLEQQTGSAVSLLAGEGVGVNNDEGYLFYESKSRSELSNSLMTGNSQWLRSIWLKSDGANLQPTTNMTIHPNGFLPSGVAATQNGVTVHPCFCF